MADGVKFANERINILEGEIERLKDFVRQSQKLFAEGWLGPDGWLDQSDTAEPSEAKAGKSGKSAAADDLPPTSGEKGTKDDGHGTLSLALRLDEDDTTPTGPRNGTGRDRPSIFRGASK